MKIGRLSSNGKYHIVHSNSIINNTVESKCGQVFSKEDVKDSDTKEVCELEKDGLLCGHCANRFFR